MKFVKYFVVLAILLCAIPRPSNAQTVQAAGGGSSAIFLELGQGAATGTGVGFTNTTCYWTKSATTDNSIAAEDTRPSSAVFEQGDMWITWSTGTGVGATCAAPVGPGINIYSYMKLDSVVGDKCYFMVDSTGTSGCVQVLAPVGGFPTAGTSPSKFGAGFTDTPLPAIIGNAVNGARYSFAGTDIRPEDAQFATARMFAPCGSIIYRNPFDLEYRLTYGLGYQNTPHVGLQVQSNFSGALFNVIDFNFSGPDPFNPGFNAPQFQVNAIGAQPIIVGVAPVTDTTGIGAATDINGHTLAMFYDGVLARTNDIAGVTDSHNVEVLVREPLSGTYNVFEYSMPNTSQFHKSQDDNFCSGTAVFSQKMAINSGVGNVAGSQRQRVIGTGEMATTLNNASSPSHSRLGYYFWSAGNANGKSNTKYLTVNGVDPLLDSYGACLTCGPGNTPQTFTPGALPQASPGAGVPPLTAVTFRNLNLGDYPIWSAVRLVGPISSAPVAALLKSLGTIDATQHDYITLANLKVWHTHFPIYGIVGAQADGPTINPLTPNDLCVGGATEVGGDAGGSNLLKQVNSDYCSDYGNPTGLVNQVN